MLALVKANLKEAADSLSAAKQRSLLALIGIAIGVGSVIAMISVGVIVRDAALAQFRELGTDILSIAIEAGESSTGVSAHGFAPDDLAGVGVLPMIAAAAPYMISFEPIAFSGEAGSSVKGSFIVGATAAFARLNKLRIETGRHLSDLDGRQYFCVVGTEVAAAMRAAGIATVVGETVRIGASVFTVVGALRRTPDGGRGFDLNNSVIIPVSTAQRVFKRPGISHITARMSPGTHYLTATAGIEAFFRRAWPDIRVRVHSAEQLIEQMYEQMRMFALMLGSVGCISLLVGGIGIMNVMLVSVTERRLEIGIRRALGARQADIQSQFLIESVVLSVIGGAVGIAAGIGATYAICQFTAWTFQVSIEAMGLGVGVASAAGVFFGFYPAYQAARLDPVAALRGT